MRTPEAGKSGVAVLIAVHDGAGAQALTRSVESIVAQARAPDQIVLVKDGPLSRALEFVIEKVGVKFGGMFTVIELETNVGLAGALNAGLEHCKYEYVARMDADDVAFPERLKLQEAYLDAHPDVDVLGTGAVEVDDAEAETGKRVLPEDHAQLVAGLWSCPLIHPSVMFRGSRIKAIGGYNESLRRRQDYELWFRAAEQGLRFANLSEPLLWYRFDAGTHRRQPVSVAWAQGLIGFRGSSRLGLAWWKRLACFVPFVRSLFPGWAQHTVYRGLRALDPRRRRS